MALALWYALYSLSTWVEPGFRKRAVWARCRVGCEKVRLSENFLEPGLVSAFSAFMALEVSTETSSVTRLET